MINVVSFSGGRTSAYLVHLMEQKRKLEGWDVRYLFMDTGAEHPKTYEFIRNVTSEFKIDLVCLRTKFNPELGKANSFDVIDIKDCKPDLKPWVDMLSKYGTPYNPGGAFCTDRMKLVPFKKYCDQSFGKGNYKTWLGIRADEPKRLKPREDAEYLASISDFEKEDILDWWEEQSFNLEIPEHLGNCVFCIKKGINKVALAIKDEPTLCKQFQAVLEADTVRTVEKRKSPKLEMYRGRNTFGGVIQMFDEIDRNDLADQIRGAKRNDTGSCSESCEVFNDESITTEEMKSEVEQEAKPVKKKSMGDSWRTPPEVFNTLNREFGFIADMASSHENALCDLHFTEEDDSLSLDWAKEIDKRYAFIGHNYVWLNCPYSNPMPWVKKSLEAQSGGLGVVMLLNDDTSVGWFAEALKGVSEIRHIVADATPEGKREYSTGRIAFLDGEGKPIPGNNKPQFVLVFNPFKIGAQVTSYVKKSELYGA
ncbi:Dam methyltransferase with PAPS reductase domain [Vibrio phage 44E38.1]|nr:putative DNA N-6-adenine methyltransferase [Vibrio phage 41E34.2]QZI91449.1 BsuMI modification methylase subunit [Vibrio phage 34E29.1]QZI91486.1 BsuMI modification methylase subunit [Vibrio phage 36E38.1]QZI91755.1 Dam methyltransferase with PAPS reductase domain [Vibrio phage 44E38.1]QZI91792.1 BsuMI modification methylase subunit [Vibrio phage 44E38.2]QZI92106.1 BsuMI modification methylase subunit [Vibrio phage 75E35.1]